MKEKVNEEIINKGIEDKPKQSTSNLITVDAFLSNSREVKQKYNSYVPIGFKRHLEIVRQKDPKTYKFLRTENEWIDLFVKFATS